MALNHIAKVESALYREISMILMSEFNDPKLGFVTVSDVKVSPDMAHAKVFVSFLGKQERNEAGLKVLNNARGYVRSLCAKKLNFHTVPQLHFVLDERLKNAQKIDSLIEKIHNESED